MTTTGNASVGLKTQVDSFVKNSLSLPTKQGRNERYASFVDSTRDYDPTAVYRALQSTVEEAEKSQHPFKDTLSIDLQLSDASTSNSNSNSSFTLNRGGNAKRNYSMIIQSGKAFYFAKDIVSRAQRATRKFPPPTAPAVDTLITSNTEGMKFVEEIKKTFQHKTLADLRVDTNSRGFDEYAYKLMTQIPETPNSQTTGIAVFKIEPKATKGDTVSNMSAHFGNIFNSFAVSFKVNSFLDEAPALPLIIMNNVSTGDADLNKRLQLLRTSFTQNVEIMKVLNSFFMQFCSTGLEDDLPFSDTYSSHLRRALTALLADPSKDLQSPLFKIYACTYESNNKQHRVIICPHIVLEKVQKTGLNSKPTIRFKFGNALSTSTNITIPQNQRTFSDSSGIRIRSGAAMPSAKDIDPGIIDELRRRTVEFSRSSVKSNNLLKPNSTGINIRRNAAAEPLSLQFVKKVFDVVIFRSHKETTDEGFQKILKALKYAFMTANRASNNNERAIALVEKGIRRPTLLRRPNGTSNRLNGSNNNKNNNNRNNNNKNSNNGNSNTGTRRQVITTASQMIREFKVGFDELFESTSNGRLMLRGSTNATISNSRSDIDWDFVGAFMQNIADSLPNGPYKTKLERVIKLHQRVHTIVFGFIKRAHGTFMNELLKPIAANTNNTSTRLHNLSSQQRKDAVSLCYSVAHAELFAGNPTPIPNKVVHLRTYGEVFGDGTETADLMGYGFPFGFMFDCRMPIYMRQNKRRTPNVLHDSISRQNGLPGFAPGGPATFPLAKYYETFGGHHEALTKYNLTRSIASLRDSAEVSKYDVELSGLHQSSMNPDHAIGYVDKRNNNDNRKAHAYMNHLMRQRVRTNTNSYPRDKKIEEFMQSNQVSSQAAYLWYDCGDTHAMRAAATAAGQLVRDLERISFLRGNRAGDYPIRLYTSHTSPLFEQSVIFNETSKLGRGTFCSHIFLQAVRRRINRLDQGDHTYETYNNAHIVNGKSIVNRIENNEENMFRSVIPIAFSTLPNGRAEKTVRVEEKVRFSPYSIHMMSGIRHKIVPEAFRSPSNSRFNNAHRLGPPRRNIENIESVIKGIHTTFMKMYKSIPAFQNNSCKFYICIEDSNGTSEVNELTLDNISQLEVLLYSAMRRSFWVSHAINLGFISKNSPKFEATTSWDVSELESALARDSMSVLERVLAYWQVYNHEGGRLGPPKATDRFPKAYEMLADQEEVRFQALNKYNFVRGTDIAPRPFISSRP